MDNAVLKVDVGTINPLERGTGDYYSFNDTTLRGDVQHSLWKAVTAVGKPFCISRIADFGILPNKGYFGYTTSNDTPVSNDLVPYFYTLLSYLYTTSLIDINFQADYNYSILFKEYIDTIKCHSDKHLIPAQKKLFIEVLNKISKVPNILDLKPIIKVGADGELIIVRQTSSGNKYIIVGPEPNEISYGFVGKLPGHYNSIHGDKNNNIWIDEIIAAFLR